MASQWKSIEHLGFLAPETGSNLSGCADRQHHDKKSNQIWERLVEKWQKNNYVILVQLFVS